MTTGMLRPRRFGPASPIGVTLSELVCQIDRQSESTLRLRCQRRTWATEFPWCAIRTSARSSSSTTDDMRSRCRLAADSSLGCELSAAMSLIVERGDRGTASSCRRAGLGRIMLRTCIRRPTSDRSDRHCLSFLARSCRQASALVQSQFGETQHNLGVMRRAGPSYFRRLRVPTLPRRSRCGS